MQSYSCYKDINLPMRKPNRDHFTDENIRQRSVFYRVKKKGNSVFVQFILYF